ncbi:gag-like protein [Lasius niger]|uniref:Gag-like protein n=1 Tax=Lasius niger TaxID=67767 RepID=A0A0J7K278_LASNI|nr:gag-like protein [Lasius niger]
MGYKVVNLNAMKNTKQTKHMVTFLGNIQIKQLIQQAKYICSTKISWEYYINKRRITQCRRCQGWGHATVNCYAELACLKCAKGYFTKDCQKSINIAAKCANCGLDHPANATICQEYQRRLKIIEQRIKLQQQNTHIEKSTNI